MTKQLPIPSHFNSKKVGEVWRVPYGERAAQARAYAKQHDVSPAAKDKTRVSLMAIDCQNTFCIPGFELFVGGQSGTGAVEDNVRLCEFIYKNLNHLTEISPTMDTHQSMQIFHPVFWVNPDGENPDPMTMISLEDVEKGAWRVNPAVAHIVKGDYARLQNHAVHYVKTLASKGKYLLTVWPYHAMLGGIGHALVSSVEEAIFFHCLSRNSQTSHEIKGGNPLTENYSVLCPEVTEDHRGRGIAQKNTRFIKRLLDFDAIVISGQAKSHCVAWTIDDLLNEINDKDPALAKKIYLLEDCTSPVVVPGIIDFTDQANEAFKRFADAGMHVVKSTDPMDSWPGLNL